MKLRFGQAPIFVQLLALALISVLAAEAVNFAVVLLLPDPPPAGFSVMDAARALKGEAVVTPDGKRLVAEVQANPPDLHHDDAKDPLTGMLREALAATLGVGSERVRVALAPDISLKHSNMSLQVRRTQRQGEFHERLVMTFAHHGSGPVLTEDHLQMITQHAVFPPFAAAYQRPDGRWSLLEPPKPFLSAWQKRLLLSFALSALLLAPVAGWMARRLARPIHAFASAAERLGRDPQSPPLAAAGPSEVRTAVGAFNDMQEKLRRYVAERTAMVAAMAHDLRAPLMRLRFRIEAAPEDVRARAAADIEQMDAMISAALAYARGEGALAPHERLDFTALAASVADDAAETGAKVSFDDTGRILVDGDALALRRMVANLADNAVKFAASAEMALTSQDGWAVLTVDDKGPGLPPEEIERVFEPFYRPDASRNPVTAGFGLGLGAARTIARAHGGDVTIENRAEGGLRATVRLPLAS